MLMIVILVVILVTALGISAWMWLRLQQEARTLEERSAVPVVDAGLPDERTTMEQQRLVYEDRLRELNEEIAAVKLKAQEDARVASGSAVLLQQQNEDLRVNVAELEAAGVAADHDAAKIDHLIVENSAFRAQIESALAETARAKAEVLRLQQDNEQLKQGAQAAMEAGRLLGQAREEYQRQLDGVYAQVEEFRQESVRLGQQALEGQAGGSNGIADELAAKVRELEAVNAVQAEKNEYLQYELTKSRAQVVGLERLCESIEKTGLKT